MKSLEKRSSKDKINDRKINVMPNSEFYQIKERILLNYFNCLKESGKIENPSLVVNR